MYKREDEINTFLLLLLLKIVYNNKFDDVLLKYLHNLSLETNTAETFSKFSLKSIEQIEILAKSNKDNQNKVIDILQKMGY